MRNQMLEARCQQGKNVFAAQRCASLSAKFDNFLTLLSSGENPRAESATCAGVGTTGVPDSANPAAGASPRSTLMSVDNFGGACSGCSVAIFSSSM